MKRLIMVGLVVSACSSQKNDRQVAFTVSNIPEEEWAIYEGKIITDQGLVVDVELSLAQAAVGVDARFKMHKSFLTTGSAYGTVSEGDYSVSYGLSGQEQGLTLHDQTKVQGTTVPGNPNQIIHARNDKVLDGMRTPELYFRTISNEKLVQTDRSFNSKDSKYTLVKRSDLFTAEGYVTCQDSLTEFFERNTNRNWKLASYGEIDSVKVKYLSLATEQFEGVYVKALAYSIVDSTAKGKKSLVIKRVLRMQKSDPRKPIQ